MCHATHLWDIFQVSGDELIIKGGIHGMKRQILKDSGVDSIAIWCVNKNAAMPAQCEILRVTSGYEGLISIHYINKNPQYFMTYQKDPWLKIIRDVRIYYSYFRWDRVTGKETSIQLQ